MKHEKAALVEFADFSSFRDIKGRSMDVNNALTTEIASLQLLVTAMKYVPGEPSSGPFYN
jgi:hypothetical protein